MSTIYKATLHNVCMPCCYFVDRFFKAYWALKGLKGLLLYTVNISFSYLDKKQKQNIILIYFHLSDSWTKKPLLVLVLVSYDIVNL